MKEFQKNDSYIEVRNDKHLTEV